MDSKIVDEARQVIDELAFKVEVGATLDLEELRELRIARELVAMYAKEAWLYEQLASTSGLTAERIRQAYEIRWQDRLRRSAEGGK